MNSTKDENILVTSSSFSKVASTETSPLIVSIKASNENVNDLIISGKQLKKNLGFRHAFAYIVSALFGSGIFISPSLVAKQTSNMGMALVVWTISGTASLFGALCFCELACMYKKTGSYYLFILEAYGEVVGFMVIWIETIIVVPSIFSILALAIGEYIAQPFCVIDSPTGLWIVKSLALISVFLTVATNSISTLLVGKSQIFFSVVQSLAVCFLIILGVWQVAHGHTENYAIMFENSDQFSIGEFGLALFNGLWAFDGWGATISIAEELTNLNRDLWLSLVTGIPFVTICFLVFNLSLMSGLTHSEIASSTTAITDFVAKVLGKKASFIIPITVGLSCFGAMMGATFLLGRVLLSAAREGQLPHVLSYIHKDRRTPIPALFCIFILSAIWILLSSKGLGVLITYFSIAVWLKYGLAIFSVVLMRKRRPDLERPFKVWLPNPIFTSLFSLFLIIIPFVKRPIESTVSLLLFLTALPVYYIFIKKHDKLPSCVLKAADKFSGLLRHKCGLTPCVVNEEAKQNGFIDDQHL